MSRFLRLSLACGLLPALALLLAPAAAETFSVEVINTRREVSGRIFGSGTWMAFFINEEDRSLNGDNDMDDTVLQVMNTRTLAVTNTGLAVDATLVDDDENNPVAFAGDRIIVQVSEEDQGGRDLNGSGAAMESVLEMFDLNTKQVTNLGISGSQPAFSGGRLYFTQPESLAKRDLNGDGDMADEVLCSSDLTSKEVTSLGMEAEGGFKVEGDWVAALTSEASQGGKDLNGDKDVQDLVVQLYQISQKKWTNTALEGSFGFVLTPKLLAVGVDEQKQGDKDLNGDSDAKDVVAEVWDLATGTAANTKQDCSGELVADGGIAAFGTSEADNGNKDLNVDKDTTDVVVQTYSLATKEVRNIGRDCSGGLAAGGGKIVFAVSEADNGNKDLNGDRDTNDYVLEVYDPAQNKVFNSAWAVDATLVTAEGYLAWTCPEADQGNRDLNRDKDADDSVLLVMDLRTMDLSPTATSSGDYVAVTSQGVGFTTMESDQGDRDLNGDGDTDDEILQIVRYKK